MGSLSTEQGKISKSNNKKYLVKDLLNSYSPNIIRLIFFTNHYSNPNLITDAKLQELNKEWGEFQLTINRAISHLYVNTNKLPNCDFQKVCVQILDAMANNLNLPQILTILQTHKKNLLTCIKQKDFEQTQKLYEILHSSLV